MYVVGLGSNLGSRFATLEAARALLAEHAGCEVIASSRVYESAPLGPPQPSYLNAALGVRSALSPEALLMALLEVEAQLGRVRAERWGARAIDLDLLWGPSTRASATLTLPHPELEARWFALAPLLDVADELQQAELRARYAPSLRALGGAPVAAVPFADPVRARVEPHGPDACTLSVEASLDDAVAALLVGLSDVAQVAHEGTPRPCGVLAAHVVESARDVHAIAARTLEHVSTGLCVAHASVGHGLSSIRLIAGSSARVRDVRLDAIEVEPARPVHPERVRIRATCRRA